jgi:hypothetical protein
MSPVVTFAFWTDKDKTVMAFGHFEWHKKVDFTIFAMVHVYDRILSPLHPGYTTIAG